jgi:hypothetical protein
VKEANHPNQVTALDRQLAALLEALGVEANQVLGAADPAGARSA